MAAFKDYYEVLGVGENASQEEIRRAYRKLAAKHHPDRNPGDDSAEDRFKEINEAYTALSDPEKRKVYDTYGRTGQVPPQGAGFGGTPGGPGGARVYTQVDPGDLGGFSDFFQTLFGGGSFGGGTFSFGGDMAGDRVRSGGGQDPFGGLRGAGTHRRASTPRSVEAELPLDLRRAYQGGEVEITVTGRRVTVTVPAGVRDGAKLRLRGQAPSGDDLILVVRHAPHPQLRVEGDDVRAVVRVPDHVAALGGTVQAPTLDAPVEVTVPPGSSSGRVLRLRGQGWPRKGGGRGDELVELRVTVPENPSEAQKALYRQLRDRAADPEAERTAAAAT